MHRPLSLGVFEHVRAADRAVERLTAAGFSTEHVSIVCPEHVAPRSDDVEVQEGDEERNVGSAVAGGSVGAALGALGAAAGILASGGTGLLVAGPIFGAGAAGAVSGGFIGAMVSRGVEPDVADLCDRALEKGEILVAVELESEDQRPRAEEALREAGARPLELPERD